jgi:hypothetical protein
LIKIATLPCEGIYAHISASPAPREAVIDKRPLPLSHALSHDTCKPAAMSVSVQPPLHFSPNHVHTPASPPLPPPAADVDISASNTLPTGQDHDRDLEMQDEEPTSRDASTNTIAVQILAVDEEAVDQDPADQDAMDVTPDTDMEILLPNGSSEGQEAAIITPAIPVPNDAVSAPGRPSR